MTTDRPFRDEPTEVLEAALGLASTHAQQAARFRPVQQDDALPAVVGLFRSELQHRGALAARDAYEPLPPPQGPEYTPCACGHIEPEHQPDAGACLLCDCAAYRTEGRTANCRTCGALIGWVDCPTGGWWAHEQHPADSHDADPAAHPPAAPPA